MIYKFTVRSKAGHSDPEALRLARSWNIRELRITRNYYIEVAAPISSAAIERLKEVLCNPVTEESEVGKPLVEGRVLQIAYKKGIIDNESDSLLRICRVLGIEASAAKVATGYEGPAEVLARHLKEDVLNPNIEELSTQEPQYHTLHPLGFRSPMKTVDLRPLNDEQLTEIGLSNGRNLNLAQMQRIRAYQIAGSLETVSDVLLESIDARWSDHCFHTTWKALGNLLGVLVRAAKDTANPNIVSMFVDNSGIWKFYDGWCLAIKAETHNGPTAISAYFGQLTKLGGVLRDIMGCGHGANPIGNYEYTAIGPIEDTITPSLAPGRPNPKPMALETIRAIKEYGNTIGVPMMWSHMAFHPKYIAKPFALGGTIGVIPESYAQKGTPEPGDYLLLIGGLTGADGIHGASASSAGGTMDTATVQIGSPLEETKFREAILELRDAGCIRAITDVGGAGLNSAVGEMGDPGGVWLNTATVPLKVAGLPTYQILLSESQERMVLAIRRNKMRESGEILEKHEVRHTVIGQFTDSGCFTVVHDERVNQEEIKQLAPDKLPLSGEVGMNIPFSELGDYPLPLLSADPPDTDLVVSKWPEVKIDDLDYLITETLKDSELADQTYAGSQYDSSVQGLSYYGPYFGRRYCVPTSFWAGTPLYGKEHAAVFSASFNPWLFEANPVLAARQSMLSILQTQVLAGVSLGDICLCDNFYTPHLEKHSYYWLVEMVREVAALSVQFGTPFISGKDSSAGSTRLRDGRVISVPPAIFISALGKVADCSRLLRNEWRSPGNLLVRIGPVCQSIAGTAASRVLRTSANDVDRLDPETYKTYLRTLEKVRTTGILQSGVPLSTGGIVARVILNALGSELGAELDPPRRGYYELLQEHRCGALVEIKPDDLSKLPKELDAIPLGRIVNREFSVMLQGHELLGGTQKLAWSTAYRNLLGE